MRIRPLYLLALPLAFAFAAAACGGNTPEPAAPTPPAAPTADMPPPPVPTASAPAPVDTAPAPIASAPTPPPEPGWKEMSKDQRKEHMKKVVQPKMADVFKAYDAKKFANVTCVTCHGEGAKQGKFDMPNPKLPKLTAADGFKKHMTKDPKITKFMMEQVVPQMASALPGVTPWDPAHTDGFGCKNCHIVNP